MEFIGERAKFNERLLESRVLLSSIKELESTSTPPTDSDAVKMMRGLFYVNVYALLERSLNELFTRLLIAVTQLNIGAHHYAHTFLPVAMDGHFSALGDPFAKRRFSKRIDFAKVLHENEVLAINSSIFESQLQSTKTSVIADILKSMGADPGQIESHPKRHYIDEISEKRNQVAHGRATAKDIGSTGRSPDLELRLEAARDFYESLAQFLEHFFNNREFMKQHPQ